MRHAIAALCLCALSAPVLAQASGQRVERAPSAPVKVQMDAIPLGSLVTLLMRDVMGVPYVIAPDVLADRRPVSVNLVMPRRELPQKVVGFLRSVGLSVRIESGTVHVARKDMASSSVQSQLFVPGSTAVNAPVGSPLVAPNAGPSQTAQAQTFAEELPPTITAIIEPAHRSPGELALVLQAILPELVVAARTGSAPSQSEIAPMLEPDRLVIDGNKQDIERALSIVSAIDKPRPSVAIRAVVMEVSTTRNRGSALSILANVLGGDVEFGSNASAVPGEQYLRLATGGLRAVLSAVSEDGRFQIIAEPQLNAVSGSLASINAGSQVPTLGAVSFSEDGGSVRSVVYRDSGVSLRVRPVVLPGEIVLSVEQERSSFVRTTTGVDDSPTLNRATASAQVSLQPGETVVIAGLDERGSGTSRQGLFGGLLGSRTKEESSSQLLLLVQADLAPLPPVRQAGVIMIQEDDPPES